MTLLAGPAAAEHLPARPSVDRLLTAAFERGSGAHRAIVRAAPGAGAAVRALLTHRGRPVHRELASISALVADLDSADLAALAALGNVLSVSADAPVSA